MSAAADAFPLDISYAEIGPWLANRRKLPGDWIQRLREIQSRSAKAFVALPVAFATGFETTDDGVAEYSTAKRIRDALAETAERKYFGGLAGDAAVWDKIVKSYEKGNLHLGEAGQRILHNVDYEAPFLKKKMESLDKKGLELGRRAEECKHNAVTSAAAFVRDCQEIGIEGRDVTLEFCSLGLRVYEILKRGFEALRDEKVQKMMEFYRAMSQELHEDGRNALPIVRQVLEETIAPPPPDIVQKAKFVTEVPQEAPTELVPAKEMEINWDFTMEETEPEAAAVTSAEGMWEEDGGIDWDIEIEAAPQTELPPATSVTVSLEPSAVVHESKFEEASAPAQRFVWDVAFRHALLDELYELQSFLRVRSCSDGSDTVALTSSEVLRRFDHSEIPQNLAFLETVLESFVSDATQRYLMLETSQSYAERLLKDFGKKSSREADWKKLAVQAEQEQASVQTELRQTAIQLQHLSRRTRDLKLMVEQGIAPLFQNRRINIMGKIHAVIKSEGA